MSRKRRVSHRSARRRAYVGRLEARIRRLVRVGRYFLSSHACDKIRANEFALQDVVNAILTGCIEKIQADEVGAAIDGKKYVMLGETSGGIQLSTVGKIVRGEEGHLYFVITMYEPNQV